MSELDSYQKRISAALDTISEIVSRAGTEEPPSEPTAVGDDSQTVTRLEEKLAREKERVEKQNEKIEVLKERRETFTTHMEEKFSKLVARIEGFEMQVQRLKDANAQLRDSSTNLREKNLELLGDANEVNQSMAAELEALKAVRAADVQEMDAILDELKPLVEGRTNA